MALYCRITLRLELDKCVEQAYSDRNLHQNDIAPVTQLDEGLYVLELWYGPTCAFMTWPSDFTTLLTTAVDSADEKKKFLY